MSDHDEVWIETHEKRPDEAHKCEFGFVIYEQDIYLMKTSTGSDEGWKTITHFMPLYDLVTPDLPKLTKDKK